MIDPGSSDVVMFSIGNVPNDLKGSCGAAGKCR